MHTEFKELLTRLTNAGYQCWLSDSTFDKTYAHIVRNDLIGYVQYTLSLFQLSTVHVPCRECGTGFRIADSMSLSQCERDIESAFQFAPHWATDSQRRDVVKYKNWEHFVKRNYLKRVLFEVSKPLEWAALWAAMEQVYINGGNEWTLTTKHMFYEMLEVLPPIGMSGNVFLTGEPWRHDSKDQGVYAAFRSLNGVIEAKYMTIQQYKETGL